MLKNAFESAETCIEVYNIVKLRLLDLYEKRNNRTLNFTVEIDSGQNIVYVISKSNIKNIILDLQIIVNVEGASVSMTEHGQLTHDNFYGNIDEAFDQFYNLSQFVS